MTPERSGDDPMDAPRTPADAAHAMKTAIRYQQQEGRLQGSPGRAGRFGRDVPAAASRDEVQMAESRKTMKTDSAEARTGVGGYYVDPHAVAEAILNRLLAGRTLPPTPPSDEA
jgi:hypothetical protein